jgi:hypothetical protein
MDRRLVIVAIIAVVTIVTIVAVVAMVTIVAIIAVVTIVAVVAMVTVVSVVTVIVVITTVSQVVIVIIIHIIIHIIVVHVVVIHVVIIHVVIVHLVVIFIVHVLEIVFHLVDDIIYIFALAGLLSQFVQEFIQVAAGSRQVGSQFFRLRLVYTVTRKRFSYLGLVNGHAFHGCQHGKCHCEKQGDAARKYRIP